MSKGDVQAALEVLTDIEPGDVKVDKFGDFYRVEFLDTGNLGGRDVPLLGQNSRGLPLVSPG